MRIPLLLLLLISTTLQAEEWVKVTIKKAFISRATFEANRDIFTEPEFGWRVGTKKQVFMRGDLYGDYFLPKGKEMELTLIEKDIVTDDVVQTFQIDATPGIKKFESGEDEFSIDVGPFFPEAKSGTDATTPTLLVPGTAIQDSVSFRDQDMTDMFFTDVRLTLFAPDYPFIQISGSGCKPVSDIQRNFVVLDCPPGKHAVSIQATPGSFVTKYSLSSSASLNTLIPGLDRILVQQIHRFDSAFNLLMQLDQNYAHDVCKSQPALHLCVYTNYRLADPATRSKMEESASPALKEILERARLDLPQD